MRNPNFLILDEPTNDLDIETLNVLEDYLATAGICLLAVSHDRFFIDKISDHIFVFEGNGAIRDFPGNYTQYRSWLKDQKPPAADPGNSPSVNSLKQNTSTHDSGKTSAGNEPAARQKLTFNEKRELGNLEKTIEALETEKAEIEKQLSGGTLTSEKIIEYSKMFSEISARLDVSTDRWLELSEKA
jgi:ABC transport system ATP-binding/permease protein